MEDDYVRCRRAYYQALTAASVYQAHGMQAKADECMELAVQILARSPEELYQQVIREHAQRKAAPRRVEAIRRNSRKSR